MYTKRREGPFINYVTQKGGGGGGRAGGRGGV